MAGPNPPISSSSTPRSHRKSRWKSTSTAGRNQSKDPKSTTKPNPSPKHGPSPSQTQRKPQFDSKPPPHFPDPAPLGPPPPPSYGFHMLERRALVLYDGSVRSYFALPPDYQDFPSRQFDHPPHRMIGGGPEFGSPRMGFRDNRDFRNQSGPDGSGSMKRKFIEEGKDPRGEKRDEFSRQRFAQYPNPNGYPSGPGTSSPFRNEEMRSAKFMRVGDNGGFNRQLEVDQIALKKAFLNFARMIYEDPLQKMNYLEDGRKGRLQCIACSRSSRDYPDMHGLIMHTYHTDNVNQRVDHLGLHKALCVLMGWNYAKPPDNSKSYKFLPADQAATNQEDLVLWPPVVIIHNTMTGRGKDGRMEGLGNKAMDNELRDIGFGGLKSKSLYNRDGHQGITLVKFAGDESGLRDAIRLSEYFEIENHGRRAWSRVQHMVGKDDEKNPNLVKLDVRTGERKRIFYGYLAIAADLDKVDFETRKKAIIESRREYRGRSRH